MLVPPPKDLLFFPKTWPTEFKPLCSDPLDKEYALAGEGVDMKLLLDVDIGGRLLFDIVLALLLDET